MKLVIAIIQDQDAKRLEELFVEHSFRATKLTSSGGFLKAGNTTFLIGTRDDRVEEVKHLIHQNCSVRHQQLLNSPTYEFTNDSEVNYPINVEIGGATIFVLPIDEFIQF